MTGDKWTFLVVRGEESPVRQYTLTSRAIQMMVGGAAFFVLTVLGIGAALGSDSLARLEARNLELRNQVLEDELEQFQDRLASLETVLDGVAANDANFRSIAGIEIIDPEVLEAGIGGPGQGIPEASPLWSTDSIRALLNAQSLIMLCKL